jgi:hypothetical protein
MLEGAAASSTLPMPDSVGPPPGATADALGDGDAARP